MKKRALFLCPSPFGVGTYFRAFAFARYLVRNQICDVDLLTLGLEDSTETFSGVRVIQTRPIGPSILPLVGWNLGEIAKRVWFLMREGVPYDLVYSFEYQPNVMVSAVPTVLMHGSVHFNDWCDWYAGRHHRMRDIRILQAIDSWLEELPRRHVDCLTTICSSLYNRALQCGVSEDRLMMVREGADINGPMLSRSEARSKLGLGYSTLLVVSMADQDQSIVREAMLVAKKLRPDSCLVLPGKPSQVGASTENILTPGRVSDEELHLWLCAADCAWLSLARSPLNEGRLPHKVGHYRIYGLPLITTDVSDAPRLGDSGICVVENTAEGFARSLENRAPLDVERRESLRAEGMRHFDWSTILEPLGERISRAIEK